MGSQFKTSFAENIFYHKYAFDKNDTWSALSTRLVEDVCGTLQGTQEPILSKDDRDQLSQYISQMKFIPGGRYLYYAGRPFHAWNNCYALRCLEDTREEWGRIVHAASDCLMTGGGIGIDYSILRGKGKRLSRTGGISSGPIPLIKSINEIGRNVMQGGSRRSALYASMNWKHDDINDFLVMKNWYSVSIGKAKKNNRPYTLRDAKEDDFNFPAPLDMTNVSVNYDDTFLEETAKEGYPDTYLFNVFQAMSTGEPGFSFNFGAKQNETLRNACCELVSEDDSDVCNLGSINLGNIESIQEFHDVIDLASKFLICGSTRATLPYQKVYEVREKNRRIGLGLMGIHDWLLRRSSKYEVTPELHEWLTVYRDHSKKAATELCNQLGISTPVAFRAIAPTGSIGILSATTTGIEPLYAVAFKRRYLTEGTRWKYEYVVDVTADRLVKEYGLHPDAIETAASLAYTPERRVKFQADIQDYVDMAISSTINLPAWNTPGNNLDTAKQFSETLFKYCKRLRGFTCYPDGARGGQPITEIAYQDAIERKGMVFDEVDICSLSGKGGTCGA